MELHRTVEQRFGLSPPFVLFAGVGVGHCRLSGVETDHGNEHVVVNCRRATPGMPTCDPVLRPVSERLGCSKRVSSSTFERTTLHIANVNKTGPPVHGTGRGLCPATGGVLSRYAGIWLSPFEGRELPRRTACIPRMQRSFIAAVRPDDAICQASRRAGPQQPSRQSVPGGGRGPSGVRALADHSSVHSALNVEDETRLSSRPIASATEPVHRMSG